MHNRRLFFAQAIVILGIGAIHILAIKWYLYWQFIWLDLPVHFLGGLWISLLSVYILQRFSREVRLLEVLVWVLLVSVAWELFELWGGIPMEDNFALDTSIDLVMDTLGGLAGFSWARRYATAVQTGHEE